MSDTQTKSEYADILNALDEMQQSPAYALRRPVLSAAEQTIFLLERRLSEAQEKIERVEEELDDWNGLFLAVTMGDAPEQMRQLANVPTLWPNNWHQDCAATALFIKGLQDRLQIAESMLAKGGKSEG